MANRPQHTPTAALLNRLWSSIPSGGSLPESVWRARHRFLVGLTFFHVVIIALASLVVAKHWELSLWAPLDDDNGLHVMSEALLVGLFGLLACWRRAGRTLQATFVGFGLMSSSAILVHLSGGYIELHFHFFVMLTFLALCQDWIPYLLAVAFVAVHHGVVGVLYPQSVYNHPAALNAPWTWAGIHALFVLWSCVGSVVAWRFNERAFAQTSLILQAAGEGIFGVDPEERITFINPAAASILGVNARAVVGKKLGAVVQHLATDGTRLPDEKSPLLAPLRDGQSTQAADQIFGRMDGSYVPVDYVSTPMVERDQLTGVVVSFNDITARHRSEAALQQSHRMLEDTLQQLKTTQQHMLQQERLRAMGQMASGIAHDFNNSLSPIVGFAELLMKNPTLPAETTQTYAQLINTAALDAASVIRRLRELYRDRSEGVIGDPVDLQRCIEEVVAMTQPRWKNQALGQGHRHPHRKPRGRLTEILRGCRRHPRDAGQPDLQRGRRDAQGRHDHRARTAGRRRDPARRQRHRHRHVGRGPAALPRAVLHDEGSARNRARALARAHDCPASRRDLDDPERGGPGQHVQRAAAACRPGRARDRKSRLAGVDATAAHPAGGR